MVMIVILLFAGFAIGAALTGYLLRSPMPIATVPSTK